MLWRGQLTHTPELEFSPREGRGGLAGGEEGGDVSIWGPGECRVVPWRADATA